MEDIFKCLICLSDPTSPSICSKCSKLYCFNCISKWVDEKSTCPNCREQISMDQIVNIRWFEDIAQIQQKQIKEGENCKFHGKFLDFYCRECNICICTDCMDDEILHDSHQFQKLAKIYDAEKVKFSTKTQEMEDYVSKLKEVSDKINTNINDIKKYQKSINQELEQAFHNEIVKIHGLAEQKYEKLIKRKMEIEQRTDDIKMEIMKESEVLITTSSKSSFLYKYTEIVDKIEKEISVPVPEFRPISFKYQSGLVALKELKELKIEVKNLQVFSTHKHSFKDSSGIEWKIDIVLQDPSITAQFKMIDGFSCPFKCFLAIKHLTNSDLDIEIKYEDEMTNGIGMVEKIANIEDIKNGFINDYYLLKIEYAIVAIHLDEFIKLLHKKSVNNLSQQLVVVDSLKIKKTENKNVITNTTPHFFSTDLVLKRDQNRNIWITPKFKDSNLFVWQINLVYIAEFQKIGFGISMIEGVENILFDIQIIHNSIPIPYIISSFVSTNNRFMELYPQRDCSNQLAKMENLNITIMMRSSQQIKKQPSSISFFQAEVKSITLKSSIFETCVKNSSSFKDELNFIWEFALVSVENQRGCFVLNGQFRQLDGIREESFKCRISIKHPKNEANSITIEYEDTFNSGGKGQLKRLTTKMEMEQEGFFAEKDDSIVFEYSIEPIMIESCLLKWNKAILSSKINSEIAATNKILETKNDDVAQSKSIVSKPGRKVVDYHDIKIKLTKIHSTTWISDFFQDNFGCIWQLQLLHDPKLNKIEYILKMLKGVENVRYNYKITHPPANGETKLYDDEFQSPTISVGYTMLIIKTGLCYTISKFNSMDIIFKICPATSNEKEKILNGMKSNGGKPTICDIKGSMESFRSVGLSSNKKDFYDMKIKFKKVEELAWKSNIFNDNFGFTWEMQLNFNRNDYKINYVLKMLKGVENILYEYKITHPPTERKFYDDVFKSPVLNGSTQLMIRRGLTFSLCKREKLEIYFKIRPFDDEEKQKIIKGMKIFDENSI